MPCKLVIKIAGWRLTANNYKSSDRREDRTKMSSKRNFVSIGHKKIKKMLRNGKDEGIIIEKNVIGRMRRLHRTFRIVKILLHKWWHVWKLDRKTFCTERKKCKIMIKEKVHIQ